MPNLVPGAGNCLVRPHPFPRASQPRLVMVPRVWSQVSFLKESLKSTSPSCHHSKELGKVSVRCPPSRAGLQATGRGELAWTTPFLPGLGKTLLQQPTKLATQCLCRCPVGGPSRLHCSCLSRPKPGCRHPASSRLGGGMSPSCQTTLCLRFLMGEATDMPKGSDEELFG